MLNKNVKIIYNIFSQTVRDVHTGDPYTIVAEWDPSDEIDTGTFHWSGVPLHMTQKHEGLSIPKGYGNTEEEARLDLITKTRMLKAYLDDEEDMINSLYD